VPDRGLVRNYGRSLLGEPAGRSEGVFYITIRTVGRLHSLWLLSWRSPSVGFGGMFDKGACGSVGMFHNLSYLRHAKIELSRVESRLRADML